MRQGFKPLADDATNRLWRLSESSVFFYVLNYKFSLQGLLYSGEPRRSTINPSKIAGTCKPNSNEASCSYWCQPYNC